MEHFKLPCQCKSIAAILLQETASVLWIQIETDKVINEVMLVSAMTHASNPRPTSQVPSKLFEKLLGYG